MRAVEGVPWLGLLAVCMRLKFNCLLSGEPDMRCIIQCLTFSSYTFMRIHVYQ